MKRILLIEDNAGIRENTAEILEIAGYSVIAVADGRKGIEAAKTYVPDLIICDIMMPDIDGYGVLNTLLADVNLQHIPFIFLTAKAERAEVRKGMELGADDYITKPFEGDELLNAVGSRLRKANLAQLDKKEGLQALQQLITASANKELIDDIQKYTRTNTYHKRAQIYAEGERCFHLYYVAKGKVKISKRNEDGKELIISLQNEGDFFGYTALLENTTYRENAEALENTELVIIPKEEFELLINHQPHVMRRFIQLLVNNITEKEQNLLSLAYNSLRKKVASTLIAFDKKYNPESREDFIIDLSRENLAAIAGVAKESLIRTLSDFRDERLISISSGNIRILEKEKLRHMIN